MDAVNLHKLLPPIIEIVSGLMITYYTDIYSQLKAKKIAEKFFPIIEFVVNNGKITNTDVQKILKTNRTSAYRILQQLSDILEMQGHTGVATYYTLKGF